MARRDTIRKEASKKREEQKRTGPQTWKIYKGK